MGKLIDNTMAVRLGISAVKKVTNLKYPSKKQLRSAVTVIEKAFESIISDLKSEEENPLLRDTDDQEIKYFMIVKYCDTGSRDSWEEELRLPHGVPEDVAEKNMTKQAQEIIESWNNSLHVQHHHDKARELVRVVKVITHTREL